MTKVKILVVEDNKIVQMDIQNRLKDLGYLVPAVASSGKEAIGIAGEIQPDLVLMDIVLKGEMDGVTAAKYIHDQLHIPVIYLTAYSDGDTMKRAKITEPFGYILKPFETKTLYITIEMALYKNQMERKLKESENWLSVTLRSVGDALITADNKGFVKFLNPVAETLTGWKNTDAAGKKASAVFIIKDEQTGEQIRNPINRALKEGMAIELGNHTLLVTKDGKEIPIEDTIAPIIDDKGITRGVVVVFRDDSKRRQAKKELEASELFNRGLVESSPVGILKLDNDGRITYENPAMRKLMGVPEGIVSPVLGKKICDLNPIKESGAVPSLEDLMKGKPINGEVFKYRLLMGPVIDLEVYAVPLKGEDGSITGAIMNVKDISDQRLKEAQLVESKKYIESIFQSITDPLAVIDVKDYTILDANKAFLDAYQLVEDDICCLTCYKATHDRSDPCPMPGSTCPLDLTVKTGKPVSIEHIHPDKSGNNEYYLISTSPLTNMYGETDRVVHLAKNITELKKSEEDLHISEEKFRNIFTWSPVGIYQADEAGKILTANRSFAKMLGYENPDDLIQNANMTDLYLNPDERKKLIDHYDKTGAGSATNLEIQWKQRDGTVRWILLTAHAIRDQNGKTRYYEGFVVDITERKRSEEEVLKFQLGAERSDEIIFMTDIEGTITYINPAFSKLYGYTKEETLGQTPRILKSGIINLEGYKQFWDTLLAKQVVAGEVTNKTKDGRLLIMENTVNPILDQEGNIIGFLAIQQDITERKEMEEKLQLSEEKYRTMVEQSNDLIWVLDIDGKLTYANNRCEEVTGYKVNSFIGESFTSLIIEDELPSILRIFQLVLNGESLHYEIHLKGINDRIFLFSVNSAPIRKASEIIGTVSFARDITDIRKAEEAMSSALEKAQESDRLKSAFLATMSHELRTPLNAVIGFSQLINIETPPDEVVKMAQRINKSGEHLLGIIEDMFDITMIESGQVRVKKEEFNVLPFLENIHNILKIEQGKAKKEGIDIVFHPGSMDRDFMLCTDKFKLGQILINLLKNALKFTHAGRIEYGFMTEIKKEESFLKFFVKDTGIGIHEKSQKIIFDIFRQVDDSHTRQYGGTGIGLSVAKKLTEILGGKIWVDSKEGIGSTFYFTIPYYEKEIVQPVEDLIVVAQKTSDFTGKTVLIAEDDNSNYEYLQFILMRLKLKTLWAKNGLDAIELSRSKPEIDLVLMDIKMPDMSGYEAAKQIKETRPGLPVIAHTAYALFGDKEKSLEAGCDDHITKPVQKEVLIKVLKKYLIKN